MSARPPVGISRRTTLAAGLALLTGCAAPPQGTERAEPVPAPRVHAGDRWRYRRTDMYTGLARGEILATVTATAPTLVVEQTLDGTPAGRETYDGAWNVVDEPIYELAQTFLTPTTIVPAGAIPGQRVSSVRRYRLPGQPDNAYYWGELLRVIGWESIDVPAGHFTALRIERQITFESPLSWQRLDCVRRDVIWYAPEVNRWVRRWTEGSWRLPGFTRPQVREDKIDWQLLEYTPAR